MEARGGTHLIGLPLNEAGGRGRLIGNSADATAALNNTVEPQQKENWAFFFSYCCNQIVSSWSH